MHGDTVASLRLRWSSHARVYPVLRAAQVSEVYAMTQTQAQHHPSITDRSAVRWSYVSGTSDTPLLGMTIGDALDRTVARFPDHDALISRHQGLRYTWQQLQDEVNRFACGLMALGIKKGDRVGIWSPSYAEWTITQYASAKVGAILVNINPGYRLHELEYALNQSGCNTLVLAPNFRATSYIEMMQTLCPELDHSGPGQLDSHKLPQLRHVIRLGTERTSGMWVWGDVLERALMHQLHIEHEIHHQSVLPHELSFLALFLEL